MNKILATACLVLASFGAHAATNDYFIVVPFKEKAAPIQVSMTLSPALLPGAVQNVPYAGFEFNTALQVSGDPSFSPAGVVWSLASGSLPAGMSLNASGTLGGTPTVGGTYAFEVQASYKSKTVKQSYQLGTVSDLTTLGTWYVSSTRSGQGAYVFDHDPNTYWASVYDAGEYVGKVYPEAHYFDRVTVKLSHDRGTVLQVYNGSWQNVYTIPPMTGTIDIPVGKTGTQIRLASTANDNVSPMVVHTLDIYGN